MRRVSFIYIYFFLFRKVHITSVSVTVTSQEGFRVLILKTSRRSCTMMRSQEGFRVNVC